MNPTAYNLSASTFNLSENSALVTNKIIRWIGAKTEAVRCNNEQQWPPESTKGFKVTN